MTLNVLHFLLHRSSTLGLSLSLLLVPTLLVPSLLLLIAKDYFIMTQISFIVIAFHYRHN